MPDGPTFNASGREAERMVIVGMTRSGKTTKLKEIAQLAREGSADIVYFDVKGLNDLGYPIVPVETVATPEALTEALTANQGAITVQLQPFGEAVEQLDSIARAAFVRGNLLFILDDAMGVEGARASKWVNNIITQGGARGVGFIAVVQRVHWVPIIFLTEAGHIIAFQIHGEEDQKRLMAYGHPDLGAAGGLQKYEYLWYSLDDRRVVAYAPIALSSPSLT